MLFCEGGCTELRLRLHNLLGLDRHIHRHRKHLDLRNHRRRILLPRRRKYDCLEQMNQSDCLSSSQLHCGDGGLGRFLGPSWSRH